MKEITQMIVVLTLICTVCGVALSGLRNMVADRIEYQILMNVQGPKVKRVLDGSDNDLINDYKNITVNDENFLLFTGKKEGKPWAIAYETLGTGFGGEIKVMVGYDLDTDKITGIQVISHKETPGIGAKVTEDQFTKRFRGLDIGISVGAKGEKCPGTIDAITGATYSSHGVCEAVQKNIELYPEIKKQALAH